MWSDAYRMIVSVWNCFGPIQCEPKCPYVQSFLVWHFACSGPSVIQRFCLFFNSQISNSLAALHDASLISCIKPEHMGRKWRLSSPSLVDVMASRICGLFSVDAY